MCQPAGEDLYDQSDLASTTLAGVCSSDRQHYTGQTQNYVMFWNIRGGVMMDRHIYFLMAFSALALQPALADTRDDVMAGFQRCRTMPDDRTWLDCTYGAQQLMRAKLGLAPAPEFQQRLVPPQSLAPLPPMSANTAARQAAPSPLRRSRPGFFQILTGTAAPVAISILKAVQYDSQGAFTATLQNGQVWHQVNTETGMKAKLNTGSRTTVKPGALGSYDLKTDDSPHVYKVELKK
jgi:hypothetical protein